MKGILTELSSIRNLGVSHASIGGRGFLSGALEDVGENRAYYWDGLKRGGDSAQPSWLFQYSLAGQGIFYSGRQRHDLEPGWAFCAAIPSDHLYYRDPGCPRWSFFWLMINEPYVTQRLLSHPKLENQALALAPNSALVRSAVGLLLQLMRGNSMELYRLEEHLFRWMLECERWADQQQYPITQRARFLDFVRRLALSRLDEKITASDLAQAFGLDRSNFSHQFRNATGQTPAAYVRQIKLEEAAQLLRGSSKHSVKEVAALTGFTGSNQFCKSFRQHYKMSPGNYRTLFLT